MGFGRRLSFALYTWFALAATVSASEVLVGRPPWLNGVIIFGQLAVLLAVALGRNQGRDFVQKLNMRWITMFHLWRLLPGVVFLILYFLGLLPFRFAVPGGVGDIFIALTAPVVANRLEFARKKILFCWHILGLLDLLMVVFAAVSLAWRATPKSPS